MFKRCPKYICTYDSNSYCFMRKTTWENLFENIDVLLSKVDRIESMVDKNLKPISRDYLDIWGALDYISKRTGKILSKHTLYSNVYKRRLASIKHGGTLLFEPSELDRWILQKKRPSIEVLAKRTGISEDLISKLIETK